MKTPLGKVSATHTQVRYIYIYARNGGRRREREKEKKKRRRAFQVDERKTGGEREYWNNKNVEAERETQKYTTSVV